LIILRLHFCSIGNNVYSLYLHSDARTLLTRESVVNTELWELDCCVGDIIFDTVLHVGGSTGSLIIWACCWRLVQTMEH
jgi:hypothetical protein